MCFNTLSENYQHEEDMKKEDINMNSEQVFKYKSGDRVLIISCGYEPGIIRRKWLEGDEKRYEVQLRNCWSSISRPEEDLDYPAPCHYTASLPFPRRNTLNADVPRKEAVSPHYETAHQPIETMQANMTPEEFVGFLKGNIIKYACRCGRKDDPKKEAAKIKQYADWLVDTLQGKTINPREVK